MNDILILGANGQVGWELQRSLAPLGRLLVCDRQRGDLEDLDGLRAMILQQRPAIIVNAAAYTAVDKAESDPERAQQVNAAAVGLLAKLAGELDAWLVHYSTDYVFDGQGDRPFREDHPTAPLNVYGRTKLAGEQAIRESGCRHLIFRTSWVYATRGANFAKTMLRLAGDRDELRVVADQVGAPTSAELIADVTAQALSTLRQHPQAEQLTGIYHLAAGGETSWHGFARFVIAEATNLGMSLRTPAERVLPITTQEYPLPAVRPANSRLDTTRLRETFGLTLPDWQFHVRRMLVELIGNKAT
ncbi:dTDP-4-dehydrorhamnose reductase [Pseudomonas sp. GD04087]|uniref:dTDP-4-dehydrorhamnose reductase n=1 Tax=unclassified Pseudomonas TaxID=196821 RepID=UPI0024481C21|nr:MULTISPECIES: dTDP-4-dehydrorhamnose reductase [unclassified Pseudomonas]MDH0289121.1 dTDP-4-dehydrorhamnose reductase [Pseudomonas sp. GD04087]MDH1047106.1 dTDP-4-dehydrorhamnose reductase [Pseudomonas sp. GD03903]MDH1998366.1 dTDP-4-dehydrorhamnose reductase [Pseudomonas sp. GD03691]